MDHLFMSQIIQKLETGRDSVHHMRDLLKQDTPDDHGCHKGLDDHSMVVLTALDSALSMLHTSDHMSFQDDPSGNSMSQDSAAQTPKKDKRGCYKRRRNVESTVVDTTTLADDGRAWRKYGQKVILNSAYPRNYYRCTHKLDQGCQATKQVQQISDKPPKYRIIYHGHHTCKPNLHKTPSIFIDSKVSENNPDSSFYLSFETNTPSPKQGTINHPSSSSFFFSNSAIKQEYPPIKMETTSEPSDVHNSSPSPSSSSPDPAITTPRSEISSAEVYSSVASPHDVTMGEDYYRQMMDTESVDLDQVLQSILYDHHYGS